MTARALDDHLPTPERMRHGDVEVRDIRGEGKRATARNTRWLDRYHAKSALSDNPQTNTILYDAGEKYLRLASAAYSSARSTLANLIPGKGMGGTSVNTIDAKSQLRRLHETIGSPHAECLMAVVFSDESAASWIQSLYRARGWGEPDRRIGMDRLRDALWHTARFWKMI